MADAVFLPIIDRVDGGSPFSVPVQVVDPSNVGSGRIPAYPLHDLPDSNCVPISSLIPGDNRPLYVPKYSAGRNLSPSTYGTGGVSLRLGGSNVFVPGDSLTAATGTDLGSRTFPNAAALLLNVSKFPVADGRGGQTSTAIAARQGGRQILVTVSGNQIPASGGVAVTAKNINVLTNAGAFTGTILGSIAGIPGTMSTDASGNWTFTRTSSGSITAAPAGTQFIVKQAVDYKDYDQWWCVGTNNPTETDIIISDIDAMIAYCGHARYRIISPLPSTAWNGTVLAAYEVTMAALRARYGVRFYDARAALQAANDGSANDLADVAAGLTPRSLRSDEVHLLGKGYEVMGFGLAATYPVPDYVPTPDLGLASAWGEFNSSTGWTLPAAYSISGGRMIRDATAGSEAIRSSVPEIVSGKVYKATVRGYRGSVNVRNGGQFISLPATDMFVQFTATASTFGFQTGSAFELLNVSVVEVV